ncbi:MAG: hypothetical protein JW863_14630 [Chitinispirillaceae bacterium]|nr:hypothetical protein [Chitinispirillaceae bacterium]
MSTPGMNTVAMRQMIASHQGAVVRPSVPANHYDGTATVQTGDANSGAAFSSILESRLGEVKFSAHAATRMKSRSIEMTPAMMGKLRKAVDGAERKGAKDSLVLLKNYAFIVNIPNRTVITAMDGASLKDNIFTNIDSAVVAE